MNRGKMNICAGFDYTTQVLTSSGAYKPIYKLVVGDRVILTPIIFATP
jgi:hypothetical protein